MSKPFSLRADRSAYLRSLMTGAALLTLVQAAPAFAAAAASEATTVEEVTVTARFREEALSSVPVAVSVISGDDVASKNLNNLQDISQSIPTVDFRAGASNKDRTVFIRGVGTITTSPGVEPSVSTVIDGVVLARPGQSTLDLMDLERIEVLRGPQGTLFGKNASAGVVNIVTKDPTDSFHGYGDISIFEGNEKRVKASVSGPLGDKLTGLISVVGARFSGNVDDAVHGGKVNGYGHEGVRVKFIATPTDQLTFTLGADTVAGKESQPTGVFVSTGRVAYPSGVFTNNATLEALLTANGIKAGANNTKAAAGLGTTVKDRNGGLSLQADYKMGDYVLSSITAYRFWKNHQNQDFDMLPALTASFPDVRDDGVVDFTQRSQEFRITSPAGGFFDYVAGLYYMGADTDETYFRQVSRVVAGAIVNDNGLAKYGVRGRNLAVYGEGNFNFTPQLRGLIGGRLIRDELAYYHNRAATVAAAITGVRPNHVSKGSISEDGWSGRVGLQYDISDSMMVYATASRGYKGPAFNTFFNMQAIDEIALKPETSKSYELGIKGSLFDGKLQGALALYDTKFDNYQANFTDTTGTPPAIITRLINAGKVSSRGIEGDFTARPVSGLRLGFAFASSDAQVDRFNCPVGSPVSCNIDGKPLPFAPKLKTHSEAEYTMSLNSAFDLQFATDYSWKDKTQYALAQTADTIQPAYGIWNASVALLGVDNGLSVRALAKNIGNQHYSPSMGGGTLAGLVRFVPRDNDRYYGVSIRKEF
jgi:iron complex outermembrane recepter protein